MVSADSLWKRIAPPRASFSAAKVETIFVSTKIDITGRIILLQDLQLIRSDDGRAGLINRPFSNELDQACCRGIDSVSQR